MFTEKLFEVATEFRFDVGEALINTKALQGAVDGLSNSTDSALKSLNFLATGLITRMGLGSGGLIGILTESVRLSQEFSSNTLNFSNTISNNMSVLSGDIHTFNDRLGTSKMLLDKIQDAAVKFGLPDQQLIKMTGMIAPPLAQHGKLGTDFENAIEMSKNLLLAAEFLQINPMMAQESLFRSLQDRMPLQAKLFSRLASTEPFKQARVTTQQQLINLPYEKKFDLIDKALKLVSGDADLLNLRLNQLGVQFTMLRNQIDVVLRPIGDAISKAFTVILKEVNAYMQTHGKSLGVSVSRFIGQIFGDPKALLTNVLQLKRIGADFKNAVKLTEVYGLFQVIGFLLTKLGIVLDGGLLKTLFMGLAQGLGYVASAIPWARMFAFAMIGLRVATASALVPFTAFMLIFQTLSRAFGIAKINDAINLAKLTPVLVDMTSRLKVAFSQLFAPILNGVDAIAQFIAPLFETTMWIKLMIPLFEFIVSGFEFMGSAMTQFIGVVAGLAQMFIGIIVDLMAMRNPLGNMLDNFKEGRSDFLAENQARLGDLSSATSNHVYNIGSINARFDLKEQLEPDRVAFAVTEEIKRMATNPIQGQGQSLSGPFTGSYYFSGVPGR